MSATPPPSKPARKAYSIFLTTTDADAPNQLDNSSVANSYHLQPSSLRKLEPMVHIQNGRQLSGKAAEGANATKSSHASLHKLCRPKTGAQKPAPAFAEPGARLSPGCLAADCRKGGRTQTDRQPRQCRPEGTPTWRWVPTTSTPRTTKAASET